jgi:hypothetical protein
MPARVHNTMPLYQLRPDPRIIAAQMRGEPPLVSRQGLCSIFCPYFNHNSTQLGGRHDEIYCSLLNCGFPGQQNSRCIY